MGKDELLQFVRAFVIHCFVLVVGSAVCEHSKDIIRKMFSGLILIASQLHFNGLQIDRILNNHFIIGYIVLGDRVSEWPDLLVLF